MNTQIIGILYYDLCSLQSNDEKCKHCVGYIRNIELKMSGEKVIMSSGGLNSVTTLTVNMPLLYHIVGWQV